MDSARAHDDLEAIHVAAVKGDLEQIIKLICDGTDLNSRTSDGMTSMMLSSLMGHKEIVELLIRKKADTNAKDSAGLTAHEYACNSETSRRKRESFLHNGIGKEDSLASESRGEIAQILTSPGRLKALRKATELGYRDYYMSKLGTRIVSFVAFDVIETGTNISSNKTLGLIKPRHAVSPLRYAMSGWGALPQAGRKMLDSQHWNNIARYHIAPKIGFTFRRTLRDNSNQAPLPEHCGRLRASHVEVQLATFYAIWATSSIVKNANASVEYLAKKIGKLRHSVQIGQDRDAIIVMDHEPCNECLRYLHALQKYTLLSFTIVPRPTLGRVRIGIKSDGCRQDIVMDDLSEETDTDRAEVRNQNEADGQLVDGFVDVRNDMYEMGFSQSWEQDEDEDSENEGQPAKVIARRQLGITRLEDAIEPADDHDETSIVEGGIQDDLLLDITGPETRASVSNAVISREEGHANHDHQHQARRLLSEETEPIDNESNNDKDAHSTARSTTTHFTPNRFDIDEDLSLGIEVLDLTSQHNESEDRGGSNLEDIEIIDLTSEGADHDSDASDSEQTVQANSPTTSRAPSPEPSIRQDARVLGAIYANSAAAAAAASLTNIDDLKTPRRPLPDLRPESILGAPASTPSRMAAHRRFIRSFARGVSTHVNNHSMREPIPYRNPHPTPIWDDPFSSPPPTPGTGR